jgi:hypothetical protein
MLILLPLALWLKEKLSAFLILLTDMIQVCVSTLISELAKIFAIIPSLDSLKNITFSTIPFIGYVNAMIPLSEFIALMVIYFTAWSIVIVFRWIKSLIPTASN